MYPDKFFTLSEVPGGGKTIEIKVKSVVEEKKAPKLVS